MGLRRPALRPRAEDEDEPGTGARWPSAAPGLALRALRSGQCREPPGAAADRATSAACP